jgi:RHS repeat-associated protein
VVRSDNAPDKRVTATLTYNIRFPGRYYMAETGLNQNYFRDYDPQVGRYVESDPVGLRGGINTYAYVADDPINGIDPFGRYKVHGNWCGPDWTGGYTGLAPLVRTDFSSG